MYGSFLIRLIISNSLLSPNICTNINLHFERYYKSQTINRLLHPILLTRNSIFVKCVLNYSSSFYFYMYLHVVIRFWIKKIRIVPLFKYPKYFKLLKIFRSRLLINYVGSRGKIIEKRCSRWRYTLRVLIVSRRKESYANFFSSFRRECGWR